MPTAPTVVSPPRLRGDLIVRRQATPAGVFAIVKEPTQAQFYRFGEVEDFIMQQLDGATELEVVRLRAESRFGAALSEQTLAQFVQKLGRKGLLELEGAARKPSVGRRLIRGNVLYLRLPLFDPARLFDRLEPYVRGLFTPGYVWLSSSVILAAMVTLAANVGTYVQDLHHLYRLSAIPIFIGVMFVVVSAHEFGHGLTCRRFGGEVHELGFMLVYFQPALYCNVSDAWLFPERTRRLWVGFAGPFFELFLWALSVLAWRVTAADTAIHFVALVIVTGSGIKTLFNFNPLIKLDGYYLLSDFLEVPNLRRKSWRYVGDSIQWVLGWADRPSRPASPRERRICLVYGAIATVYSFCLMTFATFHTGSMLITHGQPLALAALGGGLSLKLRRRVRGLMGYGMDDEEPDGEESDGESRPTKRHGRGSTRRWKWRRAPLRRFLLPGTVLCLALVLLFGHGELRVSGPVSVLPVENADVRASVEGLVEQIFVHEGDKVAVGAPIARLSDQALQADLLGTEAEIKEACAVLDKLEAGPAAEEIDVARAVLARATDQAEYTRSRQTRAEQLFERQVSSRVELDDARALATAAHNDQVEAEQRLKVLLAGSRPEEIEAARAHIELLETKRGHLAEQAVRLDVVSPVAGIVATPARQLHAMERQLVPSGGLIAKVYDFETVEAEIVVPEKEIAEVRPGQPVELRTRAQPTLTFHGKVTSIAVAAEASLASATGTPAPVPPAGEGRTFVVTSCIDNRSLLLRPGMTGHAKVLCGQRRILALVGRALARTFNVEVWSWW
jgi:putative peptide zinc metalloprotease protein